MASEAATKF